MGEGPNSRACANALQSIPHRPCYQGDDSPVSTLIRAPASLSAENAEGSLSWVWGLVPHTKATVGTPLPSSFAWLPSLRGGQGGQMHVRCSAASTWQYLFCDIERGGSALSRVHRPRADEGTHDDQRRQRRDPVR